MDTFIYDTATLVHVVPNLKRPAQFLLDAFFPNRIEYTGREFAIDVDVGKRRLAPFVSPLVQGKPVENRGINTSLFAPAYIKDKRGLDPLRPVMRAIGERIGGSLTPVEREMANLQFEMEDQVQMIDRRLEWLAASILQTGSVTISGEGYPPQFVNFQRDASLTVALAAGAKWTAANVGTPGAPGTVRPSQYIDACAIQVLQMSGAVVSDLVFTPAAWSAFLLDYRVVGTIQFPPGAGGAVDITGGITTGAMFKGVWGSYRLWLYNDWYVDPDTDVQHPMLVDGNVIIASRQMEGVRAFGAIIDPEINYGAMAYAPKSWVTHDPAQRWLMMQSAPMLVPSRVNASMCVTVC